MHQIEFSPSQPALELEKGEILEVEVRQPHRRLLGGPTQAASDPKHVCHSPKRPGERFGIDVDDLILGVQTTGQGGAIPYLGDERDVGLALQRVVEVEPHQRNGRPLRVAGLSNDQYTGPIRHRLYSGRQTSPMSMSQNVPTVVDRSIRCNHFIRCSIHIRLRTRMRRLPPTRRLRGWAAQASRASSVCR